MGHSDNHEMTSGESAADRHWARTVSRLANRAARAIIRGHAFIQNVRRAHYELGVEARTHGRVAAALTELARACVCRKNSSGSLTRGLVRAARMVCMDHGAAIHPNRPVADALGISRDQGRWT